MKLFILFWLLAASKVYATNSDLLAQEGKNSFLARANSITRSGAYASKTNPASLVLNSKTLLGVNFSLSNPDLENTKLSPTQTPSSGISRDSYKAREAESFKGYAFGVSLPLNEKIFVGVSAFLSANALVRVYTQTSNESSYLGLNDRQQRPEIYTSAGYKINENFSLGAGIYHSMKATGVFQMGVSSTDAEARTLLEAKPVMIPIAGVLYQKELIDNKKLLAGLSYRGVNDPETTLSFELRQSVAGGTVPINADSSIIAFYDPAQIVLGLGYETNSFSSYLSLERIFWSHFKPPIISLGGGDIQTLSAGGLDEKLLKFKDTWSLRLGHEFKNLLEVFGGSYNQLLGFEYHQGALEENTSSLSVLDSSKIGFSFGGELSYDNLLDLKKKTNFYFGLKYLSLEDKSYNGQSKTGTSQTAQVGGSVFGVMGGLSVEI